MIKFYPTESSLLRRQDSNHTSNFLKHQPAMLQRPGHSVILYHILELNQFTPGCSLAIYVSPQTCTLQLRIIATHLNLNVVSTSGCLQQSHMVISQCVCITSWLIEQTYMLNTPFEW